MAMDVWRKNVWIFVRRYLHVFIQQFAELWIPFLSVQWSANVQMATSQMMPLEDAEHYPQLSLDANVMMNVATQRLVLTLSAETRVLVGLTLNVTLSTIGQYVPVYQGIMEIQKLLVLLLAVNRTASVRRLMPAVKENVHQFVVLMIFLVEATRTVLELRIKPSARAQWA